VSARPADRPPLVEQNRLMARIRRFEDRAAELFQQGVIFGTAHSCFGQEAIAVGAAGVMRDTDYPAECVLTGGEERQLSAKGTVELEAGDVVSYRTCGGSGYGPPGERDRGLVARDVGEGKVSAERAREVSGWQ
jgi:N-methylhydantoinase B/oxoprolinase/acetone carboxylase alpha subunit